MARYLTNHGERLVLRNPRLLQKLFSQKQRQGFVPIVCILCRNFSDHYNTLGIERSATRNDVKQAYLKLTKELHPDKFHRHGHDEDEAEAVHQKFVELNRAYSVLNDPNERRIYDLTLPNENPQDGDVDTNHPGKYYTAATFNERAAMAGFKSVDPDYYKKNTNHYLIALGCVGIIVVGFVIHMTIANLMYEKHKKELDRLNAQNRQYIVDAKANARRFTTVQEQWADFERRRKEEEEQIAARREAILKEKEKSSFW